MIECEDLVFHYRGGEFSFRIPSCRIDDGETIALVGPSGCGKTTFLNLLAGILVPDRGQIRVDGVVLNDLNFAGRQSFRRERIGLVPQDFELLDYLSVRENLLVPFRIGGGFGGLRETAKRAEELAVRAGLKSRLHQFPDRLSQGEKQRTALCRGLVLSPRLILADEPTGNLDPENQERVVDLMLEEAGRIGATIVMITHEPTLRPKFGRVLEMPELIAGEVEA